MTELASNVVLKQVRVVYHDAFANLITDNNKYLESGSVLVVSFFDNTNSIILFNNDTCTKLNQQVKLNIQILKNLEISQFLVSIFFSTYLCL